MTDRELMQQALEALEACLLANMFGKPKPYLFNLTEAAMNLRERLVQPDQEPVAWMQEMPIKGDETRSVRMTTVEALAREEWPNPIPLYTTPPRREWVGLTDKEWAALWEKFALESEFTIDEEFQEQMVKKHGKGHYYMDKDEAWNRQKDMIQKLVIDKLREKSA